MNLHRPAPILRNKHHDERAQSPGATYAIDLTECSAPKATNADTGRTIARYFSVREDAPVATQTVDEHEDDKGEEVMEEVTPHENDSRDL